MGRIFLKYTFSVVTAHNLSNAVWVALESVQPVSSLLLRHLICLGAPYYQYNIIRIHQRLLDYSLSQRLKWESEKRIMQIKQIMSSLLLCHDEKDRVTQIS